MLIYAVATLVAVMPSVFVLLILQLLRPGGDPSIRRMCRTFLVTVAATPLAWLTVWIYEAGLASLPPTPNLAFGVALGEEGLKLGLLIWLALPTIRRAEPYTGVLLGAAVGLGYGSAENLMYVATVDSSQVLTEPLARTVTTVPFHGALGIISATLLSRTVRISGLLWLRRFALTYLLPVFLHASYITLAVTAAARSFSDPELAWLCTIVVCCEIAAVTIVAVWLVMRARPRPEPAPLRLLTRPVLPDRSAPEQPAATGST